MKRKCDTTFMKDKTTDQIDFFPLPGNQKMTQPMQINRCNTTHK